MTTKDVSITWVKQITEIGLTFMTPKARLSRLATIISEGEETSEINCKALADLIDECAAAAGAYLEKHGNQIKAEDAELITSLLGRIDGKKAVETADPVELTEWVKDITTIKG